MSDGSNLDSQRDAVVEFRDVGINLSGRQILDHLDFEVYRGETFVIIGYSGTGKSVTLRHIVGLMRPDEGSIRIGSDEITTMTGRELETMRRKFGVLFQSGALIAWLSLYENVELPLVEHTRMSKRKRREIVKSKLELVNLWPDRDKYPAQISGGMKKRAGLARAIALDPEIVLYDEPTSGLDPVIASEIDKLINRLRRELGMTQIVVTHDMESAYTIADRIGMFYHGRMIQVGTPDEIRLSDKPEVLHFITGGKEGKVSKRTTTAILRGIPPGSLSKRSQDAIEAEEREQTEENAPDNEIGDRKTRRVKRKSFEPAPEQDDTEGPTATEKGDTPEPSALNPEPEDDPESRALETEESKHEST